MNQPVPLIQITNLCAGYKQNPLVLKNISFSVFENQSLSVIGPNGSGKTTLLRVLAGVLPYTGSVKLKVQDTLEEFISIPPRKRAQIIGMLSQLKTNFFPYTVKETVLLGRYPHKTSKFGNSYSKEDIELSNKAIQSCGLTKLVHENLSTLSGGQLQRVFLAQILAQNPTILLLDEPTNHLDIRYQLELIDLINGQFKTKNKAFISVFHDLRFAKQFSNLFLLLDSGQITSFGKPEKVIASKAINQAYGDSVINTFFGI